MKALFAFSILLAIGCSQVASIDAYQIGQREVEIARNELLNALDLTPENTVKIEVLERLYQSSKTERDMKLEEYLERAEELRKQSWEKTKNTAFWLEKVGVLAMLLAL